jgi:hypothetical protein
VLVAVLARYGFDANGFDANGIDKGGRLPRVQAVSPHRGESVPDAGPAVVGCDGRRVRDGDDLATAINGAPAGTTFCVEAGTYPSSETVQVQDGDVKKASPARSRVAAPRSIPTRSFTSATREVSPAGSTSPLILAAWSGWTSVEIRTERGTPTTGAKLARTGGKPPIGARKPGRVWE